MEGTTGRFRLAQSGRIAALLGAMSAGCLTGVAPALSQTGAAQARPDSDFSPAHLCSRCHLNQMLEWGVSRHAQAETGCTRCHGNSEGHVFDERNNIKPDRMPQASAIAPLCLECHGQGCGRTKRKDNCQTCHHIHALVDVSKKPDPRQALDEQDSRNRQYHEAIRQGRELMAKSDWEAARRQFELASQVRPGDPAAARGVSVCKRRLNPALPGFRIPDAGFDPDTGLPLRAEAPDLNLRMVLVSGGQGDVGDLGLPDAMLVHTVRVEPFYLAESEVTQQQWLSIMGSNPSSYQEGFADHLKLPVETVSWEDCRQFVERVNRKVPGKGFRLPTEAEWEYALRRGMSGGAELSAVAWYRDESPWKGDPRAEPAQVSSPRPAGTRKPDALGLYDMSGNVWEWCSSLFRPYPYNPADGREDPQGKGLRVLRGGSFADRAGFLNPAFRHGERPDRRFRWNGLRLARDVPRD